MSKAERGKRGRRIRARMVELGITAKRIAAQVGCHPSYVSHIIYSRREVLTAKIARAVEEALVAAGVPEKLFSGKGARGAKG